MFNYIRGLLTMWLLAAVPLTACSSTKDEYTKNEYPASVSEAFVKSCETSGSDHDFCRCAFDRVQRKYTFEEFSIVEAKMKVGQTPSDFVEFMGKTKAECTTK